MGSRSCKSILYTILAIVNPVKILQDVIYASMIFYIFNSHMYEFEEGFIHKKILWLNGVQHGFPIEIEKS